MSETRVTGPAISGNAETNPPPDDDTGFLLLTTEHAELAASGPVDAGKTISFVSYTGLVPEFPPIDVNVTLPDGTVDGQQKQIVMAENVNVTWHIIPTSFLGGSAQLDFTATEQGAAYFVWDNEEEGWWLLSTNGGVLA